VKEREGRIKTEKRYSDAFVSCLLVVFYFSARHKSKGRTPEIFAANDIVRVKREIIGKRRRHGLM
jgi:hypothetical protein